jgi:hypothetical protein
MVIACDQTSWRKEIYPEYKAARKKNREKSTLDWNNFFLTSNKIQEELKENFAYPVISVERAEADDIIGSLIHQCSQTPLDQRFDSVLHLWEKVIIISSDKDFLQLQKYDNVRQYSPIRRQFLTCDNPRRYLFEHICRGDVSDGVPNVLSPDNTFTDGLRQTPLRKNRIDDWWPHRDNLSNYMSSNVWRNYQRNEWMIDLGRTPPEIGEECMTQVKEQQGKNNNKVFNFLIRSRCGPLIESAQDFFNK